MKKRYFSVFLALIMAMLAITPPVAHADYGDADDYREFDYSSVDSLNKYDSYEKTKDPDDDGIMYVNVSSLNRIDTTQTIDVADFRYGAYLRNSDESQYYSISYSKTGGALPSNVLTIYADPEVAFELVDANKMLLANSSGNYSTAVEDYERTKNFDHNIFYIELSSTKKAPGPLLLKFSTSSTSEQPHYSFWFGHPVPVVETFSNIAILSLGILKPKTSTSFIHPVHCTWFPRKSWIKSVTVTKKKEYDKAWISSATFQVLTPGQTTASQTQSTSNRIATFNYDVNSRTAYPAYCDYNFRFSNVKWNSSVSGPANYIYEGTVGVTFIYGLGCN